MTCPRPLFDPFNTDHEEAVVHALQCVDCQARMDAYIKEHETALVSCDGCDTTIATKMLSAISSDVSYCDLCLEDHYEGFGFVA